MMSEDTISVASDVEKEKSNSNGLADDGLSNASVVNDMNDTDGDDSTFNSKGASVETDEEKIVKSSVNNNEDNNNSTSETSTAVFKIDTQSESLGNFDDDVGEDGVVTTPIGTSDHELIKEADYHHSHERYFRASSCLKRVQDQSLLSSLHLWILKFADICQVSMQECMIPSNEEVLKQNGYKKQDEVHKSHYENTSIYYKVNFKDYSLTSRIESIIEEKLLLPIIAVLNESDLYATWMPQFSFPFRMGVSESKKLGEYGRGHQIISCTVQLPFPISNREVIQHAVAIDSIDDDNSMFVKVNSLDPGTYFETTVVEEPKKGVKRIGLDAGFLIRACPSDHPLLQHRKTNQSNVSTLRSNEDNTPHSPNETTKRAGEADTSNATSSSSQPRLPDSPLLLLTMILQVDSHVSYVPLRLVNFLTRTALSGQWHSLLSVAEEVRTGKRPNIQQRIDEKPEFYGRMEQRVSVMIENMRYQEEKKKIQT